MNEAARADRWTNPSQTGVSALVGMLSAIRDPERELVWASRPGAPAVVHYVDAIAASGVESAC